MAITEVRSETDGSYYVAFILPNGKIAVSSVCTIN